MDGQDWEVARALVTAAEGWGTAAQDEAGGGGVAAGWGGVVTANHVAEGTVREEAAAKAAAGRARVVGGVGKEVGERAAGGWRRVVEERAAGAVGGAGKEVVGRVVEVLTRGAEERAARGSRRGDGVRAEAAGQGREVRLSAAVGMELGQPRTSRETASLG